MRTLSRFVRCVAPSQYTREGVDLIHMAGNLHEQDLLKVTNKQHTYYNLLNRCLQMVRNLNTQIGSHKRKIEDWERLCMMSQNLSSLDRKQLSLLREGRRLFGTFYVVREDVIRMNVPVSLSLSLSLSLSSLIVYVCVCGFGDCSISID